MPIYDFKVEDIKGNEVNLDQFKGKVLLIVNTATKCGFTPQLKELESLYNSIKGDQFEVLAFPCNQFNQQAPESNEEIVEFCTLNYKVTFPTYAKVKVNGKHAHPLFEYLRKETSGLLGNAIKWNFTKFLIDQNGKVVKRYPPSTNPLALKDKIEELIEA